MLMTRGSALFWATAEKTRGCLPIFQTKATFENIWFVPRSYLHLNKAYSRHTKLEWHCQLPYYRSMRHGLLVHRVYYATFTYFYSWEIQSAHEL